MRCLVKLHIIGTNYLFKLVSFVVIRNSRAYYGVFMADNPAWRATAKTERGAS